MPGPQRTLTSLCRAAHGILSRYYGFSHTPDFGLFLLPACESLGTGGRVLYEHVGATDELFVGLQFGEPLARACEDARAPISAQVLAVIAEETSHLTALLDGAAQERAISILGLEVLGEIDRFLTLMHWNAVHPAAPLPNGWRNLHDVCDFMFTGERFGKEVDPLYFDAEALALGHLKRAFADRWDNSRTDFSYVSPHAGRYLSQVRSSLYRRVA